MKDSSHTARAFVGCRQDNDILSLCQGCLSANRLGRGIYIYILEDISFKKIGQNFGRNSVLIHKCQSCKNSVIKSSLWLLSVFILLYVHKYYIYMCVYPCVCVCVRVWVFAHTVCLYLHWPPSISTSIPFSMSILNTYTYQWKLNLHISELRGFQYQ